MIDYILIPLYGLISYAIGFFIAKKIYYKNGTDHYEAYLRDIAEKGSWDPHINGYQPIRGQGIPTDPPNQGTAGKK